jgi:GT2 family glycosyltransferase
MADPLAELELGDELTWEPLHLATPAPWTGHLAFAFWLVKALRPRTFVELGTHSGNSYFAFCQAIAAFVPAGRAYAVDSWAGDEHAGYYGEDVFAQVSQVNATHFSGFSTLLRTNFNDARSYFPTANEEGGLGSGIDLLHIDGLHTYEAVKHDFETWRSALSRKAVVVFHDTNVRERDFGVWRLFRELAEQHPSFEFDHSHGLGVLGVGAEQTALMTALFELSADPQAAGAFRKLIAARGAAFQRQVQILDMQAQLAQSERRAAQAHGETARVQDEAAHAQARLQNESAQVQARLQNEMGRAQAQAAELRDTLAWRDAFISAQRDLIASKQAAIAALAETLAARTQVIDLRDQALAQREQESAHRQFLVEEERRLKREMQEGYEAAISTINTDRDVLRGAVLESWDDTAASVARIYVNSTSWKATRPLRAALRLLSGKRATSTGLALPKRPPMPVLPSQMPKEAPPATPAPPAIDIIKRALRDQMKARLEAFLAGTETLHLPRSETPEVSILLVLYNQAELTFACLTSIVETLSSASFGVEVVIVDNASSDLTGELLGRVEGATVVANGANLHFLKAANLAAAHARGRHVLLLNNDAQLLPGSLASALRTLESAPEIGAVGGRIILPDGTLQEAGSIIWNDGTCTGYARGEAPTTPDVMFQRDVDYCSGAFLLTPAALFREMGSFDERFAPAYYEETDYCVRLWESGHRVVYDPDAAILHYEFGSAAANDDALQLQATNHAVFVARHADWLKKQFAPSPLNVLAARTARSASPRILVVEDRVPKVELGTGYPRANRMLHGLLEAGAQIAFFPVFRHPETWHGVRRALDKRIEVLISAEASQLRDYLIARRGHFDAILVCRPPNMEMFLEAAGPGRNLIGDAVLLYDAEALFATRKLVALAADGQPAGDTERHTLIAAEVSLTRLAGAVISVAAHERDVLEEYGVRQIHLLGHAMDEAPLATRFGDRDQIAFLGGIQDENAPNADAVRWFASEILPRLRSDLGREDVRLTVVGLNKADSIAAQDGVTLDLMGMVDELPPALARARVLVVPTRFAAGIPHKAHQAAALGIPMVVTGLIAKQLGWRDGEDLLVADDPAGFAAACARLYTDAALWERIRQSALARVQQECSPAAFNATLRKIVDGLPLVHRAPEPPAPPLCRDMPPTEAAEPPTSRPAENDWSAAVPFGFLPQPITQRLAAICHIFHVSIAEELRFYLANMPKPADLYISTDTEEKRTALQAVFAGWECGEVVFRLTPNRGRDIAPKLVGFADVHERYDLVLHLHSKMSTHADFLTPWRSYLYETLLGTPEIARSIIDAFARLPDLGMVAPQHYEAIRRWIGWQGNFEAARSLATSMGIPISPRRALDFPSGSMFWARPAALKPLLDLHLGFEDFPVEKGQVDFTPAHAIERLYFHVCEGSGHSWMKVANPALCHDTSCIAEIATPPALSRFAAEHGVMLGGPAPLAVRHEPAPMLTRVAPGLARRLQERGF